MISVDVLYPYDPNNAINIDYLTKEHIAIIKSTLGDLIADVTFEEGLSGLEPNSHPVFYCIVHLQFKSSEELNKAMPKFETIAADIPNYTTIKPLFQISKTMH